MQRSRTLVHQINAHGTIHGCFRVYVILMKQCNKCALFGIHWQKWQQEFLCIFLNRRTSEADIANTMSLVSPTNLVAADLFAHLHLWRGVHLLVTLSIQISWNPSFVGLLTSSF